MPDKNSTIIVTGSSGFIGRAVCTALLNDGYAVAGFDRPDGENPPDGVTHIPCDVTSEQSVADAVNRVGRDFGEPIASVIHLAAYYDFSGEPSPLYEQVTVRGTERLLRWLKTTKLEQFVFSSTMLVHAPCAPGQHINEDWPVDPKWDYPQSKVQTEQLILAKRNNVPVVLLRLAGVYTDRCQSIPLAHQIQRIYERRLTAKVFPGDTSTGQSFVHLDDVVDVLRATVARRKEMPPEAVILIGEPDPLSYDELQRLLAAHIHGESDWDTTQIPKAVAKAGAWVQDQIPGVEEPFIKPWMIDLADDHYALDITRARDLLGWSPRHNLRDTLPRMVTALKTDPEAFYRINKLEATPPHEEAPTAGQSGSTPKGLAVAREHAHVKPFSLPAAPQQSQDRVSHADIGHDHAEMLRRWIWRDFANILLGSWLIASPFTLGYLDTPMIWSDVATGITVVILGVLTLSPRFDLARWGLCFSGIWLLFAPLVLWTRDAGAYANDTVVGALVIAFSVLIPMMPSHAHHEVMMTPGPDTPPGWSYNPSDWIQRGPIIAMAFVGFFLSRYLAAYQLGHITYPWDPFFGDGTRRVLDSDISKAWPISDAGLGAVSYMLEALSGLMGGRNRWRTMPWMVVMFGVLVVPLGVVSIVLW